MRLTVGSKMSYPSQGPCLLGAVVKKVVAGTLLNFYQLELLDESGGELFVPVDKAQTSGLRLLIKRTEIPKLLERLTQSVGTVKDWKQRANDNVKRLMSGSAFDLAEVIDSLTGLSETKELSLREQWILSKARRLLVSEIAEVLKSTRTAAEEQVDQALSARETAKLPKAQAGSH
ncbi:MAG: CarD family transcriptional regulator [Acidobacteriota bacterium]